MMVPLAVMEFGLDCKPITTIKSIFWLIPDQEAPPPCVLVIFSVFLSYEGKIWSFTNASDLNLIRPYRFVYESVNLVVLVFVSVDALAIVPKQLPISPAVFKSNQ